MRINSTNTISSYNMPSSVRQVSFCKNPKRAPFYPETLETIDSIYQDYKKSLYETSFKDIKTAALELSKKTQIPKKDVLQAMQLLTQFSNIKSLKVISDELGKHNLECLCDKIFGFDIIKLGLNPVNKNKFCNETGIHTSLSYIFDKKELAPINYAKNGKIGVILDEEKISQLEDIKISQPKEFNEILKRKDLKYFYISGWDTGISVVDRTKSLTEKTLELLTRAKDEKKPVEKVLDAPLMNRIKLLGLKPIVIKNENIGSELTVYNQMKPQQITKNQMINIIEANSVIRTADIPDNSPKTMAQFNDKTAKYLRNTLCIYTPEKMSTDLKKMHENINNYAKSVNKEVLYVKPYETIKSLDYIYYAYKKINKIDPSKFISLSDINNSNLIDNKNNLSLPNIKNLNPKKTLLVFLDDCAISGESINQIRLYNSKSACIPKEYFLLFANLKGTKNAEIEFYKNKYNNPAKLMFLEKLNLHDVKKDKQAAKTVGLPTYSTNASAIVFPYMSPDNNYKLAANIALLHNTKYNSQNFSSNKNRDYTLISNNYFNSGSKSINVDVKKVSTEYVKLIGSQPEIIKKESGIERLFESIRKKIILLSK